VPLAAVVLDQPEAVRLIDAKGGKVPAYAYPEAAAGAIARAARYAQWRAAPQAVVPVFADVDAEHGRELVRAFLALKPGGGWLPEADAIALLRLYGISVASGPRTDTDTDTEVVISVKDDKMFGPLVVLGRSGAEAEMPAGHAARLAPLTRADADTLINSMHSAPLLNGHLGAPGADSSPARAALRDALLRVSRLVEDLPEITDLDLDPVIVGAAGAAAADARILLAPQLPQDPFLRKLRLRRAASDRDRDGDRAADGWLGAGDVHLVRRGRAIPV
jgi:hypothetical protein